MLQIRNYGKIAMLFLLAVFCTGIFSLEARAQDIEDTTLMYALDNVNVRKGPGTETEAIGELKQGETIFAVELTEEGWYRVVYGGETGYIREDFLAVYGEAGSGEEYAPSDSETFLESQPYYDPEQPTEPAAPKIGKVRPGVEEIEEDKAGVPAKAKKSRINASTIVIFALAIGSILIYGAVQIVTDKRGGGENPRETADADEPEEDIEDTKPEENDDILDLDDEI